MKLHLFHLRLAALTVVLGCATTGGFQSWRSRATSTDAVPELDSFAAPSVAAAVLRKNAEDLLWAYTASRNGDQSLGSQFSAVLVASALPVENRAADSAVWIDRLTQAINQLREIAAAGDLENRLLVLYQQNGCWNEFEDCYLGILARSPDSPVALGWARLALDYSARCGRTAEVQDALQHVARFHRNTKVAHRVRTVLEQWLGADHRSFIASKM